MSSRVQVQDCSPTRTSLTEPLTELPNPMIGSGDTDPSTASGITMRVGLGTSSTLASYGLGPSLDLLTGRLRVLACGDAPTVSRAVASASGRRAADGSWSVTATGGAAHDGIGVTVGRERFSGPPWGAGSLLVTDGAGDARVGRAARAARRRRRLGRGAVRRHDVRRPRAPPAELPLRVLTADRVVHPFVVAIDPAPLRAALGAGVPRPAEDRRTLTGMGDLHGAPGARPHER